MRPPPPGDSPHSPPSECPFLLQVSQGHFIEIPASLAVKLTPDQLTQLENHAMKHHDSLKHIREMEKAMEKGMTFEEAHAQALKLVGK